MIVYWAPQSPILIIKAPILDDACALSPFQPEDVGKAC